MNKAPSEPSEPEELQRQIEELKREVQGLRAQLTAQVAHSGLATTEANSRINEPKQTRNSLRISEGSLRAILDSATDYAIITLDLTGRVTTWNSGARHILGWEESEALGRHSEFFFTPEDRKAGVQRAELEKALTEGRAEDERWHLKKDGTRFWASGVVVPFRDGELLGYLKILRDQTGRRRVEKRLEESEQKLRQITDNLPVLIGYLDAEQRYRFNNMAYQTWVGRLPEEIHGAHVRDVLGEEAYTQVKAPLEAALLGDRKTLEWWAPVKDGSRYIKSDYVPDLREDGSIAGVYVLASDLTEFKQSQASLAESQARLQLALDAGRMAVWASDGRTGTIESSPELNRLLGFPPDATPSAEEIRSRYALGERERLDKVTQEALARGERYAETELCVVWPDGSVHWLLLRAELWKADGELVGAIGVALDITQRKRWEEHQRLLINELNHRVKNTLTTVQSIVTQTLRTAETAAEAREAVEARLLALSRAHDVLTRENWGGAHLREVVRQAIEPFQEHGRRRFTVRGHDVRLSPRIALALAMALQELGTNAVKYGSLSNEVGSVFITWTLKANPDEPHLEMRWKESGGPPVRPPARRGFGTRLIERSLAHDLGGKAEIEFAPEGVVCTISAPLLRENESA